MKRYSIKPTRRFSALVPLFLCFLLCVSAFGSFPAFGAALMENPAGSTMGNVGSGCLVSINNGTINEIDGGTVSTNNGLISTVSAGKLEVNGETGTVTNVTNTGIVIENYGTVGTNLNFVDYNMGTIGTNSGTVIANGQAGVSTGVPGTDTLPGWIGTNYGEVNSNARGSTVEKNYGVIKFNSGTVTHQYYVLKLDMPTAEGKTFSCEVVSGADRSGTYGSGIYFVEAGTEVVLRMSDASLIPADGEENTDGTFSVPVPLDGYDVSAGPTLHVHLVDSFLTLTDLDGHPIHAGVCSACGEAVTDLCECSYEYTAIDEKTHKGVCSVCGSEDFAIVEAHGGGTATCTKRAVCALCGTEYGETAAHTPSEWIVDAEGHQKVCTECGYVTVAKTGHTSAGPATEEDPEICSECGYVIAPALGHVHELHLTEVSKKDASCTADGHIAHSVCSCGKLFLRGTDGKLFEVSEDDLKIPAAHEWHSDFTVDVEPTCYREGSKSVHCARCSEVKDVTPIAKTEHTPSDWIVDAEGHTVVCTVPECGEQIEEKYGHADGDGDGLCDVCGYRIRENGEEGGKNKIDPTSPDDPDVPEDPTDPPNGENGKNGAPGEKKNKTVKVVLSIAGGAAAIGAVGAGAFFLVRLLGKKKLG